jgi:shikimate kinase
MMIMKHELLFLIGFMGCGKSTLGRQLADLLDWEFIDLDKYIEHKFRTTVPLFFKEFGEKGFRDAERTALHDMKNRTKTIVATGGGASCFFNNMDFMNQHGTTIYMQLSPEILSQRLTGAKVVRPLIKGKSGEELIQFITQKLEEREPFYRQAEIIADAAQLLAVDYLNLIANTNLPKG